jgi:exopolyphosphatase / guanosine-5'-triphosphate,3'-diphosphate pyrophosphatase
MAAVKFSRYAIIDVGTNSVKMYVFSVKDGKLETISDQGIVTGLGEGIFEIGKLTLQSMELTICVIKEYMELAATNGVIEVTALGTMALREAANRDVLIKKVYQETGLKIEVISGEDEARFSFLAALSLKGLEEEKILVFDIGGGSTEIIYGKGKELIERKSLNIGAVNMTEQFLTSDPVTKFELKELESYLKKLLQANILNKDIDIIVGIGGSIITLCAVEMKMAEYCPSQIHNYTLCIEEIERQMELYRISTISQRTEITGLQSGREGVILAGSAIVRTILRHFGRKSVLVSEWGLRHGIAGYKYGI